MPQSDPSPDSMEKPASERVIREWQNRVAAEYYSAALTADLLHKLIVLGVSPDTLARCQRIVTDELHHAELSRDVSLAAGASSAAMALEGSRMSMPQGPLLERTLFHTSAFFCCGETLARPLFRAMLSNAQQPLAKQAIEIIIKDEARHSAFGWQLLDELLERVDAPLRRSLREQVPAHIERLRAVYGVAPDSAPQHSLETPDLRWGLLERESYAQITEQCVEETLLPQYAKRGLV